MAASPRAPMSAAARQPTETVRAGEEKGMMAFRQSG